MGVTVEGLEKRFSSTRALSDVTLDVPDGKLLSVLGPSGSGKTTLLRCIAGVEEPESGSIRIGSKTVFDSSKGVNLPPEHRGIGMVFQSNALWPHLTVRKNVAYPLEIRGDRDADARVSEVLSMLRMESLADRLPSQISGGEQQRVAIARAIVYRPDLVLLDEPFSNLDTVLRESLRDELRQLQLRLGMTMLYVTHDRVDAMSIGDSLAILAEGKVRALGSPRDLLKSPPNSYTARFLGGMLVADGKAGQASGGMARVSTKFGEFEVKVSGNAAGEVVLCIPPSACRLLRSQDSGSLAGTVAGVVLLPSGFLGIRVSTDFGTVEIHTPEGVRMSPGTPVFLGVDASNCFALDE